MPLVYKEKEDLEEILSYKLSNYPEDFNEFLYLFDGKNKNINLEEREKNKKTDLRKIQNFFKYNSLILYLFDMPISNGLWYYPSLFNHSCIPNCLHFGFGDILIIISINLSFIYFIELIDICFSLLINVRLYLVLMMLNQILNYL